MRAALTALLAACAGPAMAEGVAVRLGAHDGYGRVVLQAAGPFTTERTGDTVMLRAPQAGPIASAGRTRNVLSVTGGAGVATVAVRHGARLRTMRLGDVIVLDVLDPARAAAVPATPVAAVPGPVPMPVPAAPSLPAVAAVQAAPLPSPAVPLAAAPEPVEPPPPVALLATRVAPAPGQVDGAALLPFATGAGAAAFRHGGEAWVVFDERRPVDLAAFGGTPVLAGASVTLLPAATLVRFPLPADQGLQLARQAEGWLLAATAGSAPPVMPQTEPGRLSLPAANPGQVVVVPDAETGQNLLVGTVRDAGPGVPVATRLPGFTVLPSWGGVAVEPLSDRAVLRVVPGGFAVETGDALSPGPDAGRLADAAVLTRRFDLPADSEASLLRRLQVQVADQGRAPPQARLLPRLAAAQTMIALGMGAEAQSVLRLAVAEDPRAASDPDVDGLAGIAALLAGRPAEADGLLAPSLTGTDEVALWRAVRATTLRADAAGSAPVFAATAGLVLAYPAALRNRLLPLLAETMAANGAGPAADALLARLPDEPRLTFARAMRQAAAGDTAAALARYDALALGRDRLLAARAATEAALLRLATGAIGPAEAARTLERGFLAWRGDDRERDLRVRVAGLRAQAGEWRSALDLLRETAALYPAASPAIEAQTAALVAELLRGGGPIAPIDLVALAEDNAEAVARADPAAAASSLAEKLAALDLPRRAGPVIARMAAAAPPGPDRAGLGARLAALRLAEGDATAAAAALRTTDATGLPGPVAEERGLLDARIHAANRDPGGAAAILAAFATPAADDLRAIILGDAGDWRGAAAALASLAGRTVPASGPLDAAQQDTLIRLASALARLGDDGALQALGLKEAPRFAGPRADMLRVLTAPPVSDVGDLQRSAAEMVAARGLPSGLATLGAR